MESMLYCAFAFLSNLKILWYKIGRMKCLITKFGKILLKERRSWPKQLDALEQAIKQQQIELQELRAMHNDAQIAKENARTELGKQEQSLYEAKKERDSKLEKCKKQAEEKKEHAEKVEKRVYHDLFSVSHLLI